MNIRNIALFALAAAFAAGCTPKNPPSSVDNPDAGNSVLTTGKTGDNMGQTVPGTDLTNRGNIGPSEAELGDPSKIPAEAIVYVVHFGFDKYNVEASERAKIDGAVNSLKGKRAICLGYTDHFGTAEYNLGLSDKRGNSVKSYIESAGVGNSDVKAFGSQYARTSGSKDEVADDRKVIIVDPSKLKQ